MIGAILALDDRVMNRLVSAPRLVGAGMTWLPIPRIGKSSQSCNGKMNDED